MYDDQIKLKETTPNSDLLIIHKSGFQTMFYQQCNACDIKKLVHWTPPDNMDVSFKESKFTSIAFYARDLISPSHWNFPVPSSQSVLITATKFFAPPPPLTDVSV